MLWNLKVLSLKFKKTLFWVCKDHQKSSLQLEICTNWCNLQSCVCSILMFVKVESIENLFEFLKIFVHISSIWSFENLIWAFTLMMKRCLISNRCIWMQSIIFCKEIWCEKLKQKYVQTSFWKHHSMQHHLLIKMHYSLKCNSNENVWKFSKYKLGSMIENPKMIITKIDQFDHLPIVSNHQYKMIHAWKQMGNWSE